MHFCRVKKIALLFAVALLFASPVGAQERVTTFGVAMRPIVPSKLFNTAVSEAADQGVEYRVNQNVGYAFGGLVRSGITNWLSVESGISFVRRNYTASVLNAPASFSDSTRYGIIGYEIPLNGLVFVRLSEAWYMDAGFGLSIDFFPSDVFSGKNGDFYQYSLRNPGRMPLWLDFAFLGLSANVGFEYRTASSGYFYLGASYHRPFRHIYDAALVHANHGVNATKVLQLSGNYLTIDLRYYFHEEPRPRKTKTTRPDPDYVPPSWMNRGKQ